MELGVCSWSIDRHDVLRSIQLAGTELGLRLVQIGFFTHEAVRRAATDRIRRAAEDSGVTLTSSFLAFEGEDYSSITSIAKTGGYALDKDYAHRRTLTAEVADLTAAVGCGAVAVHLGTIPEDPDSPMHGKLVARVGEVADLLAERRLGLHLETGREAAEVLRAFVDAVGRPNVAVNFDAGNFVVYGTDLPAQAVGNSRA